jgi:hypothetical protein
MRSDVTTLASSHQNGPTESNIMTAKGNMIAMLKDPGLPLEFWDKAIEQDAYISICTNIGTDSNGINRSLTKAFRSTFPDIEICMTQWSKCSSYINPKTILN